MATQVQYRRGSNVQVAAFTGALGELVIDTTNKVVVVNDGATVGGFPQVGLTATQTLTNKTYQGTSVSVTGNVDGGNIRTVGVMSATGNITGNFILGNGSQLTGIDATQIVSGTSNLRVTASGGNIAASVGGTSNVLVIATTGTVTTGISSVTGNITGGNLLTGGLISATGSLITGGDHSLTGNIVDTGALTIITSSNGNITLSPNGTGVVVVNTDIRNGQANAVGNIGSATNYFNTVFAKATSAQYADLAEMYVADDNYAPGTVVEFGGAAEITISSQDHSTRVAGVVSTNPSYLMNATQTGDNVLPVALVGRVPCLVTGTITKGDRLVASPLPGVAIRLDPDKYQPACIIGKALEDHSSSGIGHIEIAVGRT